MPTAAARVVIDVWLDFTFPICYFAKRRLLAAIVASPHREAVSVRWRAFELRPDAVTDGESRLAGHLAARTDDGGERLRALHAELEARGAKEGLTLHLGDARVVNTRRAHRLLQWAQSESAASADSLVELLLAAQLAQGENIDDPATLLRLATAAALAPAHAQAVLGSDAFLDRVREDQAEASAFGITSVPAIRLPSGASVSGGSTRTDFLRAIDDAVSA